MLLRFVVLNVLCVNSRDAEKNSEHVVCFGGVFFLVCLYVDGVG